MKKTIMFVIALAAFALPNAFADNLGSQSFGHDVNFQDSVITQAELELAGSLPEPGILPDHPLYFLKRAGERVRLFLAFNDEDKASLHLNFAKLRLAETMKMAGKNKTVDNVVGEFNMELNRTRNLSKEPRLMKEVGDIAERSAIMLAQVLEKAPESAKPAIERALNNSIEKGIEIRAEIENKTMLDMRLEIRKETERRRDALRRRQRSDDNEGRVEDTGGMESEPSGSDTVIETSDSPPGVQTVTQNAEAAPSIVASVI